LFTVALTLVTVFVVFVLTDRLVVLAAFAVVFVFALVDLVLVAMP
jgi:hypothetical protein